MFYSYDLTEFGNVLRTIRRNNGFSQNDVKNLTGINEDTLRRIENGFVIPKYESLEILSSIYKCDLLMLLQSYRRNKYFYSYYSSIDRILANNEIHLLDELIQDYERSLKDNMIQNNLINQHELKQFELFLKGILCYNSVNLDEQRNAEHLCLKALGLTIQDFEVERLNQYKYNLLEIRILFLLGLVKERIKEIYTSNLILSHVLSYLIDTNESNIEMQKIIIKTYCNLSYNYHSLDNHNLALKYAIEGIDYAIKHHNMSSLYFLFARKGVAEYILGQGDYLDSLIKCVQLLEINKQYELSRHYKQIILSKYNIVI